MQFDAPYWWLLAPPLVVYLVWLSRRSYAQLVTAARWSTLAIRTAIMVLLVAAVSRPVYVRQTRRPHAIFVLDVSKSISAENLRTAMTDIDRLAREATASAHDARVSLIAFGQDAELLMATTDEWRGLPQTIREQITYRETLPALYEKRTRLISEGAAATTERERAQLDEQIEQVVRFRDEVAGEHTDVEAALRLAANCGPTSDRRTIYVFSDANFNQGQWQPAWVRAAADTAMLHFVKLDRPLPDELAATQIGLPLKVRINQGFSAEVHVASNVQTTAKLSVFKDGYQVDERQVQLAPGDNVFPVPDLYFRDKGFRTIEATIQGARDTQLENNTARAIVVVPGEARVLYIDKDESQIPYLKTALELEGMQVEARPATGVPQDLSDMLSFDALVLSNVPAERLTLRQMQMIRSYVQEFGGGFIMLGGDESFGLGGYFNTPIEEILPVRMPIQKDMIRPSLAIVLVIDKSGSMEGAKIQLAKRAAVATAEVINPRDQIGVVGFDAESRVILELTPAADRATVVSHIASLDAGGGTFLYPALEDALGRLQQTNARRKHVIVLSDGQTQGSGYEEFARQMAADGITVSTVGIGDGADMRLLEAIASSGGGRTYFTNDFYSIPQIFTREALRASKSMLVERLFQPVATADDVCLREIDTDELPLLSGYVATTPKTAARTVLVTDAGDPLLAKWRYGLGQTVAFTSETKPRWAEDWLQWPDFPKFWSQLVRSVTGEDLKRETTMEISHTRGAPGVILTADARDASGNFLNDAQLEVAAIDRLGNARELAVDQRGPGLFEATIREIRYGQDHQFTCRLRRGDQIDPPISYGFVYSFSPEFHSLGANETIIDQVAARKSGQIMSVGASHLVLDDATGRTPIHLWPYSLIAALLLVPFDILFRRLG